VRSAKSRHWAAFVFPQPPSGGFCLSAAAIGRLLFFRSRHRAAFVFRSPRALCFMPSVRSTKKCKKGFTG
jgi:hypothetical protein